MRTNPTTNVLPFTRSYTVIPGRLLGGFLPGDRDPTVTRSKLNALLDCGITQVINLMESNERDHAGRVFSPYDAEFLRLAAERGLRASCLRRPVRDLSVPSLDHMTGTLDLIDATLAAGHSVYVHCWGGRGRTGTVMGCWLARHGDAQPLKRLRMLTAQAREHFPHVPETTEQQAFVRQWRIGQ